MDRATVAEALRQVWEGDDIPTATSLLSRLSPEHAAEQPAGMPYSILTNVAHAEFWQRIWLGRLLGRPRPNITKDWRVPAPEEWPAIRTAFLSGFKEAIQLANTEPFGHKMKSDDVACKTLLNIAVHNAYHLGQINLIKRTARKSKVR